MRSACIFSTKESPNGASAYNSDLKERVARLEQDVKHLTGQAEVVGAVKELTGQVMEMRAERRGVK